MLPPMTGMQKKNDQCEEVLQNTLKSVNSQKGIILLENLNGINERKDNKKTVDPNE